MRRFFWLAAIIVCSGVASKADAAIVNGGFESGFSGWTTTGVTSIVTGPLGGAGGPGPVGGSNQAFLQTSSSSNRATVESFLGLTAGVLNTLSTNTAFEGSAIKQTITANVGDVLSFSWDFLTNETANNTNFNDFAFWSLVSVNNGVALASTQSTLIAGSPAPFTLQTGYKSASFTFASSGSFVLGFGVMDVGDLAVNSGLLVDNVTLTAGVSDVPVPASLLLWSLGSGVALAGRKLRRGRKAEVAAA